MFVCIWCEDSKGGIGLDNKLPWHIKEEMEHFKQTTINHKVLMGSNTFFSIGKPLPNRQNYVVTHNKINNPEITIISDLNSFINEHKNSDEIIYVIGGKQIYEQLLNHSKQLIISKLKQEYNCNIFIDLNLSKFKLIKTVDKGVFVIEYYVYTDYNY